jgi:hypothetical protein
MKQDLLDELKHRRGTALPLWRTPWFLRWRGPWRMRPYDGRRGWVYLTKDDYRQLFNRYQDMPSRGEK